MAGENTLNRVRFMTNGSNFPGAGNQSRPANFGPNGQLLQDWQVSTNMYPIGTWFMQDGKWYQVAEGSFGNNGQRLPNTIEFRDYDHGDYGSAPVNVGGTQTNTPEGQPSSWQEGSYNQQQIQGMLDAAQMPSNWNL